MSKNATSKRLIPLARATLFGRLAFLLLGSGSARADCVPQWTVTPGQPGMNGAVQALTVFDSGDGPALIAGGAFTTAGGPVALHVAKWNGSSWEAMGHGLPFSVVLDLEVYDHGGAPELFAAGLGAAPNLVRWSGSEWTAVPNAPLSWIGGLGVYDSGNGPELYVSGAFVFFQTLQGPTDYIARWNGTDWLSVGPGANSVAFDFEVFDDGSGTAMFATGILGIFEQPGPFSLGIARWNGLTWSGVGGGFDSGTGETLAAFDEDPESGAGPDLYAGGDFIVAGGTSVPGGGIEVNHIARWNGRQWSSVGGGTNGAVHALAVFDEDGSGPNPPALFAAGDFTIAGGVAANRIAKWNGSAWSALGGGLNAPGRALAVLPNPRGDSAMFVGGDFTTADALTANHIATWVCDVPGDITGDGVVGINDLLAVLGAWGPCPTACPADVSPPPNGDGQVNINDLLMVLANWG